MLSDASEDVLRVRCVVMMHACGMRSMHVDAIMDSSFMQTMCMRREIDAADARTMSHVAGMDMGMEACAWRSLARTLDGGVGVWRETQTETAGGRRRGAPPARVL